MGKKISKLKRKMLAGEKARLLEEGCRLRQEMKDAEERLSEIKKEIRLRSVGNFENDNGDHLRISDRSIKSKICPKKVFNYFKRKGNPSLILSVVDINIKALQAVMPRDMVDDLQEELSVQKIWNWGA